jgi:hypothetical protein
MQLQGRGAPALRRFRAESSRPWGLTVIALLALSLVFFHFRFFSHGLDANMGAIYLLFVVGLDHCCSSTEVNSELNYAERIEEGAIILYYRVVVNIF